MAIQSFKDSLTEKIFLGVKDKEVAKFPQDVLKAAERKLDMVEAAEVLQDLASPPGNKLHALKDDLAGYHSISINDQWRVVFKWETDGAHEVEIQDYH
jgi:proteic killer suppression protein